MEASQVVRRRLTGLGLAGTAAADPVDVVHRLGAVQAQDYGPALWSLGQRTGLPEPAAEAPVLCGHLLRTHVLRPTWHLVAAADLAWLQALTADRVHAANAHYYRRNGLDEQELERTRRVIEAAVGEAGELTRGQVRDALLAAGIDVGELRLVLILMNAWRRANASSRAVRSAPASAAAMQSVTSSRAIGSPRRVSWTGTPPWPN